MKRFSFALFCVLSLSGTSAMAGAGHDHGPKHGGIVREVGRITFELVARTDSLTLHVSDHGKPVDITDAKAVVTLYGGNDKLVIELEPAGENRMTAKGSFKVGVGIRAALMFKQPNQPEVRGNFNLR